MIDYSKLLNSAKGYAKSKLTPENIAKEISKNKGKQMNPNSPVVSTSIQETTTTAQPTEVFSSMNKYLPYILIAVVVIAFFVMKKK